MTNNRTIAFFDVFDTVLTRRVGSPEAVFLFLGKALVKMGLIDISPETFARIRIEAERCVYQNFGSGATLHLIYAELGRLLNLDENKRERLMKEEVNLEEQLITVVPGAPDMIRKARQKNRKIVFVSDMYMPSGFIQNQLSRFNLWDQNDLCYVSCEHGMTKTEGLYKKILREQKAKACHVEHTGNCCESDIAAAKRCGVKVHPRFEANPNRYEKLLESFKWTTEGFSSLMAGASRLTRLSISASNAEGEAMRDVAAGVIAPVLIGYVLWLLKQAQFVGLKRLYFVARDGQILHQIATEVVNKLHLPIELRYLYGSRKAWNFPAMQAFGERELFWMITNTHTLSVKGFLKCVHLSPEEVETYLLSIGFPKEEWDGNLDEAERKKLSESVCRDSKYSNLILRRATEQRGLLLDYLHQEGFFDAIPIGLVDLGWSGFMEESLAMISQRPFTCFFFGFQKTTLPRKDVFSYQAYLFDEVQMQGYASEKITFPFLLETFCTADHGTTLSYVSKDGKIYPVLKEITGDHKIKEESFLIRQCILRFAENLPFDECLANPWADIKTAIISLLRLFYHQPEKREAKVFASISWEDDLAADYPSPIARKLGWKDLCKILARCPGEGSGKYYWQSATMTMSSCWIKWVLTCAFLFRRALQKIKRGIYR